MILTGRQMDLHASKEIDCNFSILGLPVRPVSLLAGFI